MVDEIEQRIYDLIAPYRGVYLFNNDKKQKPLTADMDLDTDLGLDEAEAEDLMEAFFTLFQVEKGKFKIETYYPDEPLFRNPFKKKVPVPVPDFTIGMLIASAKAGKWLYD